MAGSWLARLLVATVVLRALVPVGFMPDLSRLASGTIQLVICTGTGSKLVTLDENGKPVPAKSSAHADQACPFAGSVLTALPQHGGLALSHPQAPAAADLGDLATVLPPARAGPPLGSRGPPLKT